MRFLSRIVSVTLCLFLLAARGHAQQPAINFHKLGFTEGLHDGIIRCIAQDRFGYTWVGSVGAINRFDGRKITQYTYIPGDTSSPYSTQPRCMHADKSGRFWIGSESGLMEFDFTHGNFKRIAAFRNQFISAIESIDEHTLIICTRLAAYRYDTHNGTVFNYNTAASSRYQVFQHKLINDICISNGNMFFATNHGLIVLDAIKDTAQMVNLAAINDQLLLSVTADANGTVWIAGAAQTKMAQLAADLKSITVYDQYLPPGKHGTAPELIKILPEKNNRVWVITFGDGLLQFDPLHHTFDSYLHNAAFPSGPSSNSYRCMFQDKKGIIWLGCDVDGVNYFDPDQNLFTPLFPFPIGENELYSRVGRAVTVDAQGNVWMGNHDGLTKYDVATKQYRVWRNTAGSPKILYSNLVRSLYCDAENNIWIGTAEGVNRFNAATRRIEFIESKSLPLSFYNSINGDSSGNIWFCTNDTACLYWYAVAEKTFYPINKNPLLAKYTGLSPTSYVLEDSRHRLWISFSRKGIVMVDKAKGTSIHYTSKDNGQNGIIGNQVIDIKEDRNGVVWATSFNGVTAIDADKNTFTSYNIQNGLPGNMAAAIAIDSLNRVWVGVNGGLTMIGADRKQLTVFSLSDGLPSVGFPEHAAITTANGAIIMPTYNGYFRFNPADYKERKDSFNFYVTGYSLFDKDFNRIKDSVGGTTLHLDATQNSFSFYIAALNYINPSQTWYAYKLEGFEKDWHYTKDPKAVYTNIPGGTYRFLYKAAASNSNWNMVPEKNMVVQLDTVFYKTIWFAVLSVVLFVLIVYFFYRYRTRQRMHLYQLNEKAQLLEKEKALVMYENLKQHLNPHFLFNSLTSLSSLIRLDQNMAGDFLDKMSKVYRYILKNRDNEVVPLSEEMKFVQLYIDLQKTRFENGLQVHMNIDEDYHHRRIAPVTLQNLVENSIKHNTADEDAPLVIDLFIEEDYLVVRNNLQKKKFVETSNRQGLANMESLYRYLSTRPMLIIENEQYFIVKIPLL